MSSRRLFLSGLRSSRARLRFAGVIILSNTKCRAPACEVYHEQRADSQQSSAVCQNQQLLALSTPNPGRILYLRKARSLSQRSGPPQKLEQFPCRRLKIANAANHEKIFSA